MLTRARSWWAQSRWRWPLNVLSVLLMLPFAFWLTVAALGRDEPLRDAIDPLLKLERPAEDPGNLYYVLVGLGAPETADAHRVGTLSVQIAFDQIDQGRPLDKVQIAGDETSVLPLAPPPSVCEAGSRICLAPMKARVADLRAWDRAHAQLADRFLDAARLPRYADVDLGADVVAMRLASMAVGAYGLAVDRWVRGDQPVALEVVERTVTVCRRVLGGTVAPALKRAAAHCVEDGWTLAAELALDVPRARLVRLAPALRALATPLSAEERAVAPLVRAQARMALPALFEDSRVRALVEPANTWQEALQQPFYRRNATLNRYAERWLAQAGLDRLSDADLPRYVPPPLEQGVWQRVATANPIGLAAIERMDPAPLLPLARQVRALEAPRRLLVLTVQCALDATLPKDRSACAAGVPADLRDPLTSAVAQWDGASGRFRFVAADPPANRR